MIMNASYSKTTTTNKSAKSTTCRSPVSWSWSMMRLILLVNTLSWTAGFVIPNSSASSSRNNGNLHVSWIGGDNGASTSGSGSGSSSSSSSSTSYYYNHLHHRNNKDKQRKCASVTSTSLSMGIRSFIRNKVGGGSSPNDDSSEDPADVKQALKAIQDDLKAVQNMDKPKNSDAPVNKANRSTPQIPASTPSAPSTLNDLQSLTTNPTKKKQMGGGVVPRIAIPSALDSLKSSPKKENGESVRARSYGETARDRIQRMKSGSMTEDEKASFLNTALSPRVPGTGAKKGPPIRQPIPEDDAGGGILGGRLKRNRGGGDENGGRGNGRGNALWNSVMGSPSDPTSASPSRSQSKHPDILKQVITKGSEKNLSDSAKRDYLDMVTNPDRFKSYAAMGGSRTSTVSPIDESDQYIQPNEGSDDGPSLIDPSTLNDTAGIISDGSDAENDTLATRLSTAAARKEESDSASKLERQQRRESEMVQRAEIERKLQEERLRNEQMIFEQKRMEAEKEQRRLERLEEDEERRMKEMLAAQDAYWANKMGVEKNDGGDGGDGGSGDDDELEQIAKKRLERDEEIRRIREEERARENPHESQILQEAAEDSLQARQSNAKITEVASAQVTRTVPQDTSNKDSSVSSFVQEQEEKKAALDKLVQAQKARLSTLSSPLPSPGSTPATTVTPQPAVPTTTQPVIPRVTSNPIPPVYNKPPPQPKAAPTPGLSLSELTMNKSKNQPSPAPVVPPPPPSSPPADDAPRLSLAQMTMLKKPENGAGGGNNAVRKPPSSSRARNPNANPVRQRVVRQQVPLQSNDDEEEDDFFEFSRDGNNKNMSLKDIMDSSQNDDDGDGEEDTVGRRRKIAPPKKDDAKEKSKMWGIDIDQFN